MANNYLYWNALASGTLSYMSGARPRISRRKWIPSVVIMLAAFAMVFGYCGREAATRALWTDDVHSLRIAEESPAVLLGNLRSGAPFFYEYPPLYFLLLHQVLKFGDAPFLIRLPSLLFAGLALAIWGLFARRRGIPTILCLAAIALSATHPTLAFQAINVRMYTMLLLLGTIPMVVCGGALPAPQGTPGQTSCTLPVREVILIGMVLGLACYTAYFALTICGALALIAAFWIVVPQLGPPGARNLGIAIIAACVLCGLLYIPWMPTAYRTLTGSSSLDLPATSREARYGALLREIPGTVAGVIFLLFGWAGLFAFGPRRWQQALGWSVAPGVLTVVLLLALSPAYRAVFTRYVLFIIPPLYLGAVAGWNSIARRLGASKRVCLLLTASIAAVFCAYQIREGRRTVFARVPDWWAAADLVESQASHDEIILTGGYLTGEAMLYHMKNPDRFQFRHYASTYEDFAAACADPRVVWCINAQVLPPRFAAAHDNAFPNRIAFPGNAGLGMIQIGCKHKFAVPAALEPFLVERGPGNSDPPVSKPRS